MKRFFYTASVFAGAGIIGVALLAVVLGLAYGIYVLLAKLALWGVSFFWPSAPRSWRAAMALAAVFFALGAVFGDKGSDK